MNKMKESQENLNVLTTRGQSIMIFSSLVRLAARWKKLAMEARERRRRIRDAESQVLSTMEVVRTSSQNSVSYWDKLSSIGSKEIIALSSGTPKGEGEGKDFHTVVMKALSKLGGKRESIERIKQSSDSLQSKSGLSSIGSIDQVNNLTEQNRQTSSSCVKIPDIQKVGIVASGHHFDVRHSDHPKSAPSVSCSSQFNHVDGFSGDLEARRSRLMSMAFRQHGNLEYYTDSNLAKRERLRQHPLIISVLEQWWARFDWFFGIIIREQYVEFHVMLAKAMSNDENVMPRGEKLREIFLGYASKYLPIEQKKKPSIPRRKNTIKRSSERKFSIAAQTENISEHPFDSNTSLYENPANLFIYVRDLRNLLDDLGYALSLSEFTSIVLAVDPERSGKITFENFSKWWEHLLEEENDQAEDALRSIAEQDWVSDSLGEGYIDKEKFFNAIFEVADIWSDSVDLDEYFHVLSSTYDKVFGEGQVDWQVLRDTVNQKQSSKRLRSLRALVWTTRFTTLKQSKPHNEIQEIKNESAPIESAPPQKDSSEEAIKSLKQKSQVEEFQTESKVEESQTESQVNEQKLSNRKNSSDILMKNNDGEQALYSGGKLESIDYSTIDAVSTNIANFNRHEAQFVQKSDALDPLTFTRRSNRRLSDVAMQRLAMRQLGINYGNVIIESREDSECEDSEYENSDVYVNPDELEQVNVSHFSGKIIAAMLNGWWRGRSVEQISALQDTGSLSEEFPVENNHEIFHAWGTFFLQAKYTSQLEKATEASCDLLKQEKTDIGSSVEFENQDIAKKLADCTVECEKLIADEIAIGGEKMSQESTGRKKNDPIGDRVDLCGHGECLDFSLNKAENDSSIQIKYKLKGYLDLKTGLVYLTKELLPNQFIDSCSFEFKCDLFSRKHYESFNKSKEGQKGSADMGIVDKLILTARELQRINARTHDRILKFDEASKHIQDSHQNSNLEEKNQINELNDDERLAYDQWSVLIGTGAVEVSREIRNSNEASSNESLPFFSQFSIERIIPIIPVIEDLWKKYRKEALSLGSMVSLIKKVSSDNLKIPFPVQMDVLSNKPTFKRRASFSGSSTRATLFRQSSVPILSTGICTEEGQREQSPRTKLLQINQELGCSTHSESPLPWPISESPQVFHQPCNQTTKQIVFSKSQPQKFKQSQTKSKNVQNKLCFAEKSADLSSKKSKQETKSIKPMSRMMEVWIDQQGSPVLWVQIDANDKEKDISHSQSIFDKNLKCAVSNSSNSNSAVLHRITSAMPKNNLPNTHHPISLSRAYQTPRVSPFHNKGSQHTNQMEKAKFSDIQGDNKSRKHEPGISDLRLDAQPVPHVSELPRPLRTGQPGVQHLAQHSLCFPVTDRTPTPPKIKPNTRNPRKRQLKKTCISIDDATKNSSSPIVIPEIDKYKFIEHPSRSEALPSQKLMLKSTDYSPTSPHPSRLGLYPTFTAEGDKSSFPNSACNQARSQLCVDDQKKNCTHITRHEKNDFEQENDLESDTMYDLLSPRIVRMSEKIPFSCYQIDSQSPNDTCFMGNVCRDSNDALQITFDQSKSIQSRKIPQRSNPKQQKMRPKNLQTRKLRASDADLLNYEDQHQKISDHIKQQGQLWNELQRSIYDNSVESIANPSTVIRIASSLLKKH